MLAAEPRQGDLTCCHVVPAPGGAAHPGLAAVFQTLCGGNRGAALSDQTRGWPWCARGAFIRLPGGAGCPGTPASQGCSGGKGLSSCLLLCFVLTACQLARPDESATRNVCTYKWMDTSKAKNRFTGHGKLVGPGRKQGKLSCKVRIHIEVQEGLYAAPSPMALDAHGAKSICIKQMSTLGPLFYLYFHVQ